MKPHASLSKKISSVLFLFVFSLFSSAELFAQCAALPDSVKISVSASIQPCVNKSGEIQIKNNTSYAFEYSLGGQDFSSNTKYSGLAPGRYVVHIRNGNAAVGCIEKDIPQPSKLEIVSTRKSDETCQGRKDGKFSYKVQGGSQPYTIQIKTPVQEVPLGLTIGDTALPNLSPGEYTVIVTDNNNCTATHSFIIIPAEKLTIVRVDTTSASSSLKNDGQIIVRAEGGRPDYKYGLKETELQNSRTFSNLAPGNYIVYIQDRNGCVQAEGVCIRAKNGITNANMRDQRNSFIEETNKVLEDNRAELAKKRRLYAASWLTGTVAGGVAAILGVTAEKNPDNPEWAAALSGVAAFCSTAAAQWSVREEVAARKKFNKDIKKELRDFTKKWGDATIPQNGEFVSQKQLDAFFVDIDRINKTIDDLNKVIDDAQLKD